MKHASARLCGVPLLTGVLTACAGVQEWSEPSADLLQQLEKRDYRLGEEVRMVPSFEISGWNHIDERHMQIDGGPGRTYLVTFHYPCRELAWADRIGYTDSAGTFGRSDRIVVFEAGRRVDCPVGKLHKLERIDRDPAAPKGALIYPVSVIASRAKQSLSASDSMRYEIASSLHSSQ